MAGRIIIISAPSGCGKSTIIKALMKRGEIDMKFSVSATNRSPREGETDGVDYLFLSTDEFQKRIADNEFVEWEEVYSGRYYGTLRSEIKRITDAGHNCILDIDVKGALNVKRQYSEEALSLFIEPPSVEELRRRLENRATDNADEIARRVEKAAYEISFAKNFDKVIVNDDLDAAIENVEEAILNYLNK